MKKQMIGLILSGILAVAVFAGCSPKADGNAAAENTANNGTGTESTAPDDADANDYDVPMEEFEKFTDPQLGIRFDFPEAWMESQNIAISNYPQGMSFEMITEKGKELEKKLEESFGGAPPEDGNYTAEQQELIDQITEKSIPFCGILAEKEGEKDTDMRAAYDTEKVLGEKDGTTYTLLTNENLDAWELSDADKQEYEKCMAGAKEFEKSLELLGPQQQADYEGTISFDSKTVDGKQIDSSVFKDYKLTAINIWATWCNPCVAELPELQKLYQNMPEGTNFMGICTDGEAELDMAKQILEKSGVKYDNVAANEEMLNGFLTSIQSFPTTIFVDSQGNMVGEPFVGAPSGDVAGEYRKAIEERLALLDS